MIIVFVNKMGVVFKKKQQKNKVPSLLTKTCLIRKKLIIVIECVC